MVTYKKKSLKVEIIRPLTHRDSVGTLHIDTPTAERLKEFIEKGHYSRIADIFFYGDKFNVVCMVIYEAEQALQKGGAKT